MRRSVPLMETGCVTADPSTLRPFAVPVMPARLPPTLMAANCAVEGTAEPVEPAPTSEVTETFGVPLIVTAGVDANAGRAPLMLTAGVEAKAGSEPVIDTEPETGCVTAEPSTLRPLLVPVMPTRLPETFMPAYCAVDGTAEPVDPAPISLVTATFGVPLIVAATCRIRMRATRCGRATRKPRSSRPLQAARKDRCLTRRRSPLAQAADTKLAPPSPDSLE